MEEYVDVNAPREDHISWDEFYMGLAIMCGYRSKDPSSQVGSCIVSPSKRVVSLGYNGMPGGHDELPWCRGNRHDPDPEVALNSKYHYVVHSEANAIMNSKHRDLDGCTIYVTLFPCNECTKLIVQSGIKEVVYLDDKYHDSVETAASRRILDTCGVTYRKLIIPEDGHRHIEIDLSPR